MNLYDQTHVTLTCIYAGFLVMFFFSYPPPSKKKWMFGVYIDIRGWVGILRGWVLDHYNLTLVNFLLIKQFAKQHRRNSCICMLDLPAIYESGRWVETAMINVRTKDLYNGCFWQAAIFLDFFLFSDWLKMWKPQHPGDSMWPFFSSSWRCFQQPFNQSHLFAKKVTFSQNYQVFWGTKKGHELNHLELFPMFLGEKNECENTRNWKNIFKLPLDRGIFTRNSCPD